MLREGDECGSLRALMSTPLCPCCRSRTRRLSPMKLVCTSVRCSEPPFADPEAVDVTVLDRIAESLFRSSALGDSSFPIPGVRFETESLRDHAYRRIGTPRS